jgi:hypothetical protein
MVQQKDSKGGRMKVNIGYLGGTDPMFLSHCAALGIATVPLSNGYDNHGKYINMLSKEDNVGLVVAPFHKLIPPTGSTRKPVDFLVACRINKIPVLVVAPEKSIGRARKKLADRQVNWATPVDIYDKAMDLLKKK